MDGRVMATVVKPWNDGRTLTIDYTGDGDGYAVFSSTIDEGVDQEMKTTFKSDISLLVEAIVKQAGIREVFNAADEDFILADGGKFNVIKNNLL